MSRLLTAFFGIAALCSCTTSTAAPSDSPVRTLSSDNRCAGDDPLVVASMFLAAVNADNRALYSQCVYPGASGDELAQSTLASSVAAVRDGDFVVTDVIQRPGDMYAFNSRANVVAESTATEFPVFDVGGRVDITVALKPDRNYYVTKIGYEVHG